MTAKNKKTVQPVTDTEIKAPEAEQAEVIKPEPAQPKPEPPITLEMVAERQVAFEKEVENGLNSLIERLTPMIQLSDRLAQQQKEQSNPEAPSQANMGSISQLLPLLTNILGGGGGGGDAFQKMAMDSMMEEIKFSRTFRQLFLSKFAGESLNTMVKTTTEG
jgi:hypothetical protein